MIFCAPCCHHHVQAQLAQQAVPDPFRPIMRHGILREEMGTLLTDALRALILRIMGYRTDVIEFVSAEHTPKNNLIRAVRRTAPGDPQFARIRGAQAILGVTPCLETLLGDRFRKREGTHRPSWAMASSSGFSAELFCAIIQSSVGCRQSMAVL